MEEEEEQRASSWRGCCCCCCCCCLLEVEDELCFLRLPPLLLCCCSPAPTEPALACFCSCWRLGTEGEATGRPTAGVPPERVAARTPTPEERERSEERGMGTA